MTEQAQRIAIAEACGWRMPLDKNWPPSSHALFDRRPVGRKDSVDDWITLPDYLHDLNACHEAEKVLSDEQFEQYGRELLNITAGSADNIGGDIKHARAFVSTTAAQRAEAFLRTLGKWEDGK